MSTVLLINQGHTDNIGDQAINAVLTQFLKTQEYTVYHAPYEDEVERCWSFAFDKRETVVKTARHMSVLMDYWNRKRIKNLLNNIGHIDYAVIGGGELLASSHRGFSSAFPIWCELLHARHIPIAVTGVSGDFVNAKAGKRYAKALGLCSYISVRDHSTERLIHDQYGIQTTYFPDVVFAYTQVFPTEGIHLQKKYALCIPVPFVEKQFCSMGIYTEKEYISYINNQFVQHDVTEPVIVTSTLENEIAYPEHVANEINENGEIKASTFTGLNLDQFIDVLQQTSIVVSGRMHACILGMLYNCEVVPIPYRQKLKVFSSEYASVKAVEDVTTQAYKGLQTLDAVIGQSK